MLRWPSASALFATRNPRTFPFMANTDALKQRGARAPFSPTLKSHLAYTLLSGLVIMLMLSLVRLALLV